MRARAFATFLVIWIVAIAGVLVAHVQSTSFRQAASGREQLGAVRAKWAARAGIEATIARLGYNTESPDLGDAFRVNVDMEEVAYSTLDGADWLISHETKTGVLPGPADAHARLNVSLMTAQALSFIPLMTDDVVDAILDWVDADDDVRPFGAEYSYYLRDEYPYEPRNAPMRTISELELVAGAEPEIVRGEDWDLDDQLDLDENDAGASWPADNADNVLDRGWTEHLTAASWEGSQYGASGEPILDLAVAAANDLTSRLGVDRTQADAILAHSLTPGASVADFLTQNLAQLAQASGALGGDSRQASDLTDEQLALILDECSIGLPRSTPGKLNINTAEDETIEYIPGITLAMADAINADRAGRQTGYTSLMQLLEIQGMSRQALATLYPYITVRSNVYVVACRGRDRATGIEVELVATIDRATLPITIREISVR
jgi:type II secretory pathway component PulK